MQQKKIFILGAPEKWKDYHEAVALSGATAVFSENTADAPECDGLLLTGGGDINPKLFGQENTGSKEIDDARDAAEYRLLDLFCKARKPVLGICRGHQVITTYFGGTLIQDLPAGLKEVHQWSGSDVYNTHPVTVRKGCWLDRLYGESFVVNSAHHQSSGIVPKGFEVLALSGDGVIESIADESRKIYGIQWHPEKMCYNNRRTDTADGRWIFESFISQL